MSDADARMDRLRRAARYRLALQADEDERAAAEDAAAGRAVRSRSLDPDEVRAQRRLMGARDMVAHANHLVDEGVARGVFEHNALRGKPLPDNDGRPDPDWWIRRYVEREQLTGLGPPALALRKEDAELDDRLDEEVSERAARDVLEDFNARIREARRQLLGGPPVVTPMRDVDDELARWRSRRDAHVLAETRAVEAAAERERADRRAHRWWRRALRRH